MKNELFAAEEVISLDTIISETNDSCSGCNGCAEEEPQESNYY